MLDTRARDEFGETCQRRTGFAGLPAPCSSSATCGCFWRLYAAARHLGAGCALLASHMCFSSQRPLCAKSGHQYVSSLLTEKLLAWTYRWVVTGIRDFFAHRNKADIS